MTGKLVSHKLPRKTEATLPLELKLEDNLNSYGDAVVVHRPDSPSEAIRVVDSSGVSITADSFEDATVTFSTERRSRHGEEGVEQICAILIERLNQSGPHWEQPKRPRREGGVDCEASDGEEVLKIQVTRAEPSQRFWQKLSTAGQVAGCSTVDDSTDILRAAIDRKSVSASNDVVLALDATDTPGFAFQAVTDSFRKRHGPWAAHIGFKQIWLVGPTARLTERLDTPDV